MSLSSGSSARSVILRQDQMSSYIDAPTEPLNCIMMMIVMNGWPLSAIENPYLRQAFKRVAETGHQLSASRYILRRLMIRKHKAMKDEVIKHLKQKQCAVSFVLDGWTNVSHHKVTNVLLVCRGQAYYWCSITNRDKANTARYLANALAPVIRGIEDAGIPVVSYVADNEEVMSATHRRLLPDFDSLIRIPCAAHTIQLIVKKVLAQPPFAEVLKEYIEMLNLFSVQKELRHALVNAQPTAKALNLIRPCETRWSYTLVSIEDLVHSKTRNRSGPDMIEAQMFLRFNAPLLHSDVVPSIPLVIESREMLPDASKDTDIDKEDHLLIRLDYLLDVEPVDAAAAAAEDHIDLIDPMINDVEEEDIIDEELDIDVDQEEEKDISAAPASAAAPDRIATTEEENELLRLFIVKHNIKPSPTGRVIIVGHVEGWLSTAVEEHEPPIKTQLKVLKTRLSKLCRDM
jgi:hypothetical protein